MTLTELRYLVALADLQHFGRAAERCHVSQPSLSAAIKNLESELGVALFERTKSWVKPTDLGLEIVGRSRSLLATTHNIKAIADAGKNQLASPLSLGVTLTIGPYLLPQLIPYLRQQVSSMPLRVQEDCTDSLHKKLCEGVVDAIVVSLPFIAPNIVTQELFAEPLVIVMPRGHRLARKPQVRIEDLEGQQLILMASGNCLREQVLALLSEWEALRANTLCLEGNSLETLRNMVAAGLGLAILPHSAAGERICQLNQLAARPLDIPGSQRHVGLAWRASFPRPRAIEVLRRAIQTCSGAYWDFATEPDTQLQTMLAQ